MRKDIFLYSEEGFFIQKNRIVAIFLLFAILTLLEAGIFIEVLWHGWGGFGGISLEYTATGSIGAGFLIFFIPLSVCIIFLIRMALCIKKPDNRKRFVIECICALAGVGIVMGTSFMAPKTVNSSLVYQLGRQVAACSIDYFDWMTCPIAG